MKVLLSHSNNVQNYHFRKRVVKEVLDTLAIPLSVVGAIVVQLMMLTPLYMLIITIIITLLTIKKLVQVVQNS